MWLTLPFHFQSFRATKRRPCERSACRVLAMSRLYAPSPCIPTRSVSSRRPATRARHPMGATLRIGPRIPFSHLTGRRLSRVLPPSGSRRSKHLSCHRHCWLVCFQAVWSHAAAASGIRRRSLNWDGLIGGGSWASQSTYRCLNRRAKFIRLIASC